MPTRYHLPATTDAVSVLGSQLAAARRRQRRTMADVADRAGITRKTLGKIEAGDPTVTIGIVFDVAAVLRVPLFGASGRALADLAARGRTELALLPARIDPTIPEVDDDF